MSKLTLDFEKEGTMDYRATHVKLSFNNRRDLQKVMLNIMKDEDNEILHYDDIVATVKLYLSALKEVSNVENTRS